MNNLCNIWIYSGVFSKWWCFDEQNNVLLNNIYNDYCSHNKTYNVPSYECFDSVDFDSDSIGSIYSLSTACTYDNYTCAYTDYDNSEYYDCANSEYYNYDNSNSETIINSDHDYGSEYEYIINANIFTKNSNVGDDKFSENDMIDFTNNIYNNSPIFESLKNDSLPYIITIKGCNYKINFDKMKQIDISNFKNQKSIKLLQIPHKIYKNHDAFKNHMKEHNVIGISGIKF